MRCPVQSSRPVGLRPSGRDLPTHPRLDLRIASIPPTGPVHAGAIRSRSGDHRFRIPLRSQTTASLTVAHGWKPVGGYIQREGHTASRKPLTASRESDTLIIARKSRGLLGTRVETPPAEGTLWQEAANIQSFILSAAFLYRMPKPYFIPSPMSRLPISCGCPTARPAFVKTWIRFLQDGLAENPAIERAMEVPPFKFAQWDGKVCAKFPGFASSAVPPSIPTRSRPAMPRWRSRPGACSIDWGKRASLRRE